MICFIRRNLSFAALPPVLPARRPPPVLLDDILRHPDELANELIRLLEDTDFHFPEVWRTVKSDYQRKGQCPAPGSMPKYPSNIQTSLLDISPVIEEDQMAEKISGEELRALIPTFPDEVYGWLPGIFAECVRMPKDKREKDGILLACITIASNMLPTVSCRYNRRKYGTNLYSIIIAPSGNSKGLLNSTVDMCAPEELKSLRPYTRLR